MTYRRFFLLLTGTTLLAALAAGVAHWLLDIGFAVPLTVIMIFQFLAVTVALFYLGKRTAGARNKTLFGNVFMGVTGLQLFIAGGVVMTFFALAKPPNKFFVVPFFTTYLLYSILQVVSMIALAGEVGVEEKGE